MSRSRRESARITKNDRIAMRTNGCCYYCGERLSAATRTRDHLTPRSRGGSSALANLVLSCHACNSDKGVRTLDEYREARGGEAFYGDASPCVGDLTGDPRIVRPVRGAGQRPR